MSTSPIIPLEVKAVTQTAWKTREQSVIDVYKGLLEICPRARIF